MISCCASPGWQWRVPTTWTRCTARNGSSSLRALGTFHDHLNSLHLVVRKSRVRQPPHSYPLLLYPLSGAVSKGGTKYNARLSGLAWLAVFTALTLQTISFLENSLLVSTTQWPPGFLLICSVSPQASLLLTYLGCLPTPTTSSPILWTPSVCPAINVTLTLPGASTRLHGRKGSVPEDSPRFRHQL